MFVLFYIPITKAQQNFLFLGYFQPRK